MSAWQTMDDAPKDGTVILLARPKHNHRMVNTIVTGHWREGKGWRIVGSDQIVAIVTHWMPLPAPPLPGESNARPLAGPSKPNLT